MPDTNEMLTVLRHIDKLLSQIHDGEPTIASDVPGQITGIRSLLSTVIGDLEAADNTDSVKSNGRGDFTDENGMYLSLTDGRLAFYSKGPDGRVTSDEHILPDGVAATLRHALALNDGPTATCKHCGRIVTLVGGRWVDTEATDDDVIWRETCDSHDTFTAEHEPIPDFIWPDPSGEGWIDAWNGWYDTLERALDEAPAGVGTPWRLKHGQGLLPAE